MPRRQSTPMKYWGFYTSEELKSETQRIAEKLDESDAEYIRKAVEQRNAEYKSLKNDTMLDGGNFTIEQKQELEYASGKPRPSIQSLKETVKQIESKIKSDSEFKTFFKNK